MDIFPIIVIIGVVLSAIGGTIWWVIVFLFVKTAVGSAQHNLDNLLPNIEATLRQAAGTPTGQLPLNQQTEVMNMFLQAQNQMNQLDGLHRRRYENRVGELMSMGASVGIDWSPGSY
jgi:hypothetical protein